jgi:hypothetical protein
MAANPKDVIPRREGSEKQPISGETQPISDSEFSRAYERLRGLSDYVLKSSSDFDADVHKAAMLGPLNALSFNVVRSGRRATESEWQRVEESTHAIWAALTEQQRRNFFTGQVPWWLIYTVVALLVIVVGAVAWAFFSRPQPTPAELFLPYLFYVAALGAMGAAASIAMNALALQDDITFNISSSKMLSLRLGLGALFGTVLTFVWNFPLFQEFVLGLSKPLPVPVKISSDQVLQSVLLLMPFVVGFSTSLVILILARLVESAQTFFGKGPASGGAAPAGRPGSQTTTTTKVVAAMEQRTKTQDGT